MRLSEVLKNIEGINLHSLKDVEIKGITDHSKQCKEGFIFVAVQGESFDGNSFIKEAIERGAKVIIHSSSLHGEKREEKDLLFIKVPNSKDILPYLAANFYREPASKLKVIGVTGTNGKTTTAYLIESIIKRKGFKTGLIGTINYRFGERLIPATNTTPGAIKLQELLYNMVKEKIDYVVMEVSSHGLAQGRVKGISFSAGIFTNISLDHLDYHKTFEEYFNAKAILFENLSPSSSAIINIDDPYGKEMLLRTNARSITYGIKNNADVEAYNLHLGIEGSKFSVSTPYGKIEINTSLLGLHNIYNLLSAISFGIAENFPLEIIKEGIEEIKYISGRLEAIDMGQSFKVFVDYAHTDEALRNVLFSLRTLSPRRIILIFGCGGNRWKEKRPLMGKIASELADFVILTTDNPRSEEPETIINDIERGFSSNFNRYKVILDRYAAIKEGISMAEEGDVVLIAGKGHETYQIFKHTVVPFDDREVAKEILLENNLLYGKVQIR